MNKTHRLIWNDARHAWIVTHEAARSRGRPASATKRLAAALALLTGGLVGTAGVFAAPPAPTTLPSGGQVVAGQASISQSGSSMRIQQASDKAILNWQSFSIGSQASVTFQQPSSSSVALNRVLGADPSAIHGALNANGQVFLINPSGVLFGASARVDVGGLVASTLAIRNEDFLAGKHHFARDGAAGSVQNHGELYGKYIALLAPEVRNEGVIAARLGSVALAAGQAATLSIAGNRLIDVKVDKASFDTLVENRHLVQADAGLVILSAQSANGLLGQAVNTGLIEAKGIDTSGGTVRLLASSNVSHSGSIDVSAGKVGTGGTAILLADLSNTASQTTVSGSIAARGGSERGDGGFIETSAAHLKIADSTRIDTRATSGRSGQWLIDPDDFTIAASGGDMTGATLAGLLGSTNVEIKTLTASGAVCLNNPMGGPCGFGSAGTNSGDIVVNDAITWNAATSLMLTAYRDIRVNSSITASHGASAVYLLFGQEISGRYMTGGSGSISAATVFAPDGTTFSGTQLQAGFTSNPTAFVKLDSGQSNTYGVSPTLNYSAYGTIAATGGALATGTGGTWAAPDFGGPIFLTSTTPAGTNGDGYSYAGGLPNTTYFFVPAGPESWTVNKANLTLSGSRTYDGSTNVAGSSLTATGVNSETFSISGTSSVASKDASTTAQALTSVASLTLGASSNGGLSSNYNALSTSGSAFTINKADLTLSGSRTYDGSTAVAGSSLTASGVNSETFSLTGTSSVASKDASTTPQALANVTNLVLGSGNSGNAVASNYNALSTTGSTFTINKANLTLSGSRAYDGTTAVDGTILTATGVNSETFSLTGTSSVASKDASTSAQALANVTNLVLGSGNSGNAIASNYNALSTTGSAFTINKANLTLSGSRTYDGTTAVDGTILTATGVNSETFGLTGTSSVASKDASTTPQALANVTNLVLGSGNSGNAVAGNYNALSTSGSAFTINKRTVTLSGSKTYDGTTNLSLSQITLGNRANNETLNLGGTATASDKEVATANKYVNLASLTLADGTSGTVGLASNYQLPANSYDATNNTLTITAAAASTPQSVTDIIKSALTQAQQAGDSKATNYLDIQKSGTGIEQSKLGEATTNIKAAIAKYCSACGAVTDADIQKWLGTKADANTAASASATSSGANTSLKVTGTVNAAGSDVGKIGTTYVAGVVNGVVYLKSKSGAWTPYDPKNPVAYETGVTLGSNSINILDGTLDVSGLTGAEIYIGYGVGSTTFGASVPFNNMLTNGSYTKVYSIK